MADLAGPHQVTERIKGGFDAVLPAPRPGEKWSDWSR